MGFLRTRRRKLTGGVEAYHLRRAQRNAAYVERHGIANPRYRFRHPRPKNPPVPRGFHLPKRSERHER